MRQELRILGPVFLVLLAGYLATSFHDGSFSLGPSLTGGAITDQSGTQRCPTDKILFKVSAASNAHAELATQGNYNFAVCWDGQGSTQRACNPTNSNVVLRLSDITNAHAEKKQLTTYSHQVCFGNITCDLRPRGQCLTVGPTWRCAASVSAETNAHVAECGVYDYDLCCSDGSTSGGGQYRPDTDGDGVFDIGLGNLRNIPCNPLVHSDLSQCADNCINDRNAQQEDQDSDGAGDVCDDFPTDSCSILQRNDNCPHLQQCRNLAAQWSTTSISEGDPVGLTVIGSAECGGRIAHFQVFDKINRNLLTISPQPANFNNGSNSTSASSSWTAEYYLNESNDYYFQVTVTGGSSQIQISSPMNQLLTVQRRSPGQAVCGNGRVEGSNNEQCDDGNTRNGDGCSANCTREGNFTGGATCQDDPQCRGVPPTYMVCQSDPTQAYFCITGPGGCRRLSNPLSCGRENSVQRICDRGADSCRSPTCNFQRTNGPCVNGQMTISCTATGGSHCVCGTGYPRTVSCTPPHTEEPFPVFTGTNIVVTILLLMLFYTFRRGARWKSR